MKEAAKELKKDKKAFQKKRKDEIEKLWKKRTEESTVEQWIKLVACHILEIWQSPTLKISGHLQCHLQSCVATSLYARKVIFF